MSWSYSTDIGNHALAIGVDISILIYPVSGVNKLSIRSKKYDVSILAKLINGGGGHEEAAGCDLPTNIDLIHKLTEIVDFVKI